VEGAASRPVTNILKNIYSIPVDISLDLTLGATYIPHLAGLGRSMDALGAVPIASALLGPVVGLAAAKAAISHFRYVVRNVNININNELNLASWLKA